MKRILICAAAAIVALASCSKTQVVYNDAPEEIGFKAVTGAMTKAALGESSNTTMEVAAYLSDGTTYFPETVFEEDGSTNQWYGQTARYWPTEESTEVNFIAYSPAGDADFTSSSIIIRIPDNKTNQVDWLYSDKIYSGTKESNKTAGVPVKLSHALAKVSVNLICATDNVYKFKSLVINDTKQAGTITVTYNVDHDSNSLTEAVTTCEPSNASGEEELSYTNIAADSYIGDSASAGSVLVFPGAQTSFTLTYSMEGSAGTFTADIPLEPSEKWEPGKHYTYDVTMTTNQIFVVPSVNGWDDVSAYPIDVE